MCEVNDKVVQYEHYGVEVSVRESLKGKHREHCLCYICGNFKPGSTDQCPLAKKLYDLCVKNDMVTPVWECREYVPEDSGFGGEETGHSV